MISWSLPLPLGYCTTDTFVIALPSMVSSTWTGPHRVWATDPVTVLVCEVPVDPLPEGPVSPPDDSGAVVAPPLTTELGDVVANGPEVEVS